MKTIRVDRIEAVSRMGLRKKFSRWAEFAECRPFGEPDLRLMFMMQVMTRGLVLD
jgi:hypothetical protein